VSKDEKLETAATEEGISDSKEKDGIEEVHAEASEETAAEATPTTTEGEPVDDGMKWYVVHTYSGYEQKARLALKERIKQHRMDKLFGDVLIPSENVIELVRGEKKTTSRKFFPGYVLVKMILNDTTWHLVKSTPKITGFVGNALTPPAVPEEEVARITNQMAEGTLKPRPKVQFEEGESVRVVDGPFVNFNGVVEEVKPDKGKLRVLVSIFGRSTPVELDFVQVEKN
jgi:transcriptional antiterminator NusG